VAFIRERLDAGARLVTLCGLGGVGKSRLALAAAHALAARGEVVVYVEAARAATPDDLAAAIARAADLTIDPNTPAPTLLYEGLAAAGRRVIVIDGLEHLAEGAVPLLEGALAASPWTSLLVTSRVPLARPVEEVVPVPPLGHADAGSPAVALLRERARGAPAWDDEAGLARLARRLDGIPLALELAAARARLITPADLVAVLDAELLAERPVGGPAAALVATVAWSWQALSRAERHALTCLAAVGRFDLPGAAAALGAPLPQALALIEALERVALVAARPSARGPRFEMLDTVRELAARWGEPGLAGAAWERYVDALLGERALALELFASRERRESAFEEREHLAACARRALAEPTPSGLTRACKAAVRLLPAFELRRLPLAFGAPWVEVLHHPAIDTVAPDVRVAAAVAVMMLHTHRRGGGEVARELGARVRRWLSEPLAPAMRLEASLRLAWEAIIRWELVGHVVDEGPRRLAMALGDAAAVWRATTYEARARRLLMRARLGVDDRAVERVAAEAEAAGQAAYAVTLGGNVVHLLLNLGAAEQALAQAERALARRAEIEDPGHGAYTLRERGLCEVELGRLADGAASLAQAIARLDAPEDERARVEATLDDVALALERGEHERARGALAGVAGVLDSAYERGLHAALAAALAALSGQPRAGRPPDEPTGTVEDRTITMWWAVAERAAPPTLTEDVEPAAAYSSRLRQALRVWRGVSAPGALMSTPDGSALRVGAGAWIELEAKPALRVLWRALLEARRARVGSGVGKARLAELLWPAERLREAQRDNRLQVNVTTLRKLGLGDALEAHEGGYRVAPSTPLVICARRYAG